MIYRIQIKNHEGQLLENESRKRIDAAKLLARKLAYEYLSYNGALDTSRAHVAMVKIEQDYNRCDCKMTVKLGVYYTLHLDTV